MKKHTVRLCVAAATLAAFFLLWVVIAAKPWTSPAKRAVDPRLAALTARQRQLQKQAADVRMLVSRRWAIYRRELRVREREIVAARKLHAKQVAAAQAAAARISAMEAAAASLQTGSSSAHTVTTYVVSRVSSPAAAAAPASQAAPSAATPPPPVQVVTLPPVTSSSSSRP